MTARHILSIRLPKAQRWATYLTLITVATSGILWWVLRDVLHAGWMLTEQRLLITHGIAAAAALVLVGGLLPLHIRLAWRAQCNLASGTVALSVMAVLAATGLLLYYAGEEERESVRWAHIGAGVLALLALPAHVWLGRRLARQASTFGAVKHCPAAERARG